MKERAAIWIGALVGCTSLPAAATAACNLTDAPTLKRLTTDRSAADHPRIAGELQAMWQVITYDSDYAPSGLATAFAINNSLLATNAHVVDAVAEALGADGRVFVVQHETGIRQEITAVWRHPGYFSDERPGPDVGLLRVDGALSEVLPLVSTETARSLSVGTELRTYGFPGDVADALDAAHEVWGLDRPRATAGFGRITAIRPLHASGDATPHNALLIQHDIRSVGGNSGSPILDKEGHVIAISAMGFREGDSGQGLAIRADALRPLVDLVNMGVLPPLNLLSEPSESATGQKELLSEVIALLEDGEGWVITWPVAIIGATGLLGLVVLQRARFGHRRHRELIARLDRFVEAVDRRFDRV